MRARPHYSRHDLCRQEAKLQRTCVRTCVPWMSATIALCAGSVVLAQSTPPALERYFARVGLTSDAQRSVASGGVEARLLPVKNDRDVAVVGVTMVRAPQDFVVAQLTDVAQMLTTRGTRFQLIGVPPAPADVQGIEFDQSEYRDLRNCKQDDCDFKLPASAMRVFAQQVDWSGPRAKQQADSLLRIGVLRVITDYQRNGSSSLPTYEDKRGVHAGEVFDSLLAQSADLYAYAPELDRHLRSYPVAPASGMRDLFFWAQDHLPGLRPTLTLNHVVTYVRPGSAPLIARKQLWANHYFEAGFELLAVIQDSAGSNRDASYVVTVRRFRFDNLPRGLLNIRGRVRQRLVEATRSDLERDRATIEAAMRR